MKLKSLLVMGVGLSAITVLAANQVELKSNKDKLSYIIGLDIGKKLKTQALEVDPKIVARGIQDGISGSKPLLEQDQIKAVLSATEKDMEAKHAVLAKKMAKENKAAGDAFLQANAKKPGVHTLPDGLQYKVLREGNGPSPKITDTVVTQYKGTLIDGTVFDSSYQRGQPATFPVKGVIKGWTEALQKMKVGSKWRLFIPPDLAYGQHGAGAVIGPNATLVFDIELLKIQDGGNSQN